MIYYYYSRRLSAQLGPTAELKRSRHETAMSEATATTTGAEAVRSGTRESERRSERNEPGDVQEGGEYVSNTYNTTLLELCAASVL